MERTTILLPDDLHEQLRRDAFQARTSMAELIRARLRRPNALPRSRGARKDPILKVAGICRWPILSSSIDDGVWRLTGFFVDTMVTPGLNRGRSFRASGHGLHQVALE
jgi:hypothetical protein